jgi:hypothetical protein
MRTFNNDPPNDNVSLILWPYRCNSLMPLQCKIQTKYKIYLRTTTSKSSIKCYTPRHNNLFIKVTYYAIHFAPIFILKRKTTYQSLLNDINSQEWTLVPILLSNASAQCTTHIPTLNALSTI